MSTSLFLLALAAAPAVAGAPARVVSYPAAYFAPYQPNTALDMIAHVPGFVFDSGGSVRGFGGAAGNVLVDGARPASKDDGLDDVLRRIPASSVQKIEIIQGGAPGVDMQGKTVLANLVRRRDIRGKLTINASTTHGLDSQASGNLLIEGEKRIGQTALEGSLRIAEFLDSGDGAGTWTRADASGTPYVTAAELSRGASETYKATGAVETPVLGGRLRLNASISVDPYAGRQVDTLQPAPGSENDRFTFEQDSLETGARFERNFTDTLSIETFLLQRLGRQRSTDDFQSDAETSAITGDGVSAHFNLTKHTGESIGRVNVTMRFNPRLSLEVGGEGAYNWLTSHTYYVENDVLTPLPAANVHVDELRGEAYATTTWQALRTLTVEAGMKIEASHIASAGDVISARDLYYPKPHLTLAWSPGAGDQLRVRIEREVGQLNFDDFTAQTAGLNTGTVHAGNPSLDPDLDWVFEAAWEHHFWRTADASVTVRHYELSQVEDRVGVPSPSGTYDAPGNIGSGTKDELAFSLAVPTDRIGLVHGVLTGDATLRRSRVVDPATDQSRDISGLHRSDWAIHFTQGLPRWKASWGADVFGPWTQTFYRFDEIDTDKLKLFATAFAEIQPHGDLTFKVEVLNLFGQGFAHSRQVFADSRSDSAVAFTDVRDIRTGRFVRVRVIKSFP